MSAPVAASAQPARFRDQTFSLFRLNMLSYALRLFTSVIVARELGPEALGLWILLSLFPTYADGFARLKVDVAAIYVLGKGMGTFAEVSAAIHFIALVTGGLFALALAAAEPWVMPALFGDAAVSAWTYRLVLLTIPVNFIATNYSYLMLHREDVAGYNRSTFLRGVIPSVLGATLLVLTPLKIEALVIALLAGGVIAVLYGINRMSETPRPQWPRDRSLWRRLFSYSGRLYAAGLVEHFNQYLSSLLLGIHLRPADLTYFRMGQDRLQLLDQVPASLNTVLYPKIANASSESGRRELVARSCRVLLLLLCGAGLLGALLSPLIVRVLYGLPYMPMVSSIWLLLPGVIALGATQSVMQYFAGSGRADLSWKLPIVPLIAQILLIIPLMNLWGFRGAALALSLSFLLYAVVRIHVWSMVTGERRRDLVNVGAADVRVLGDFLRDRIGRIRLAKRSPGAVATGLWPAPGKPAPARSADTGSRLVIVSVPLVRIARVTLSEPVLGYLRKISNVVVIAPFADQPTFQAAFNGHNTEFMKWQEPRLNRFQRWLFAASEVMRVHGYWMRHRKRETAYFAHNRLRVFGENGADKLLSPWHRLVFWLLGRMGTSERAWMLADRMLPARWSEHTALTAISRSYRHVTLIQSANWGMQDRALASLSRREGWRTALVPYTTDQLDTNGFLLNSFDAICPQGPFEYQRAVTLHQVAPSRLRHLGSAWFRHLEQIRNACGPTDARGLNPLVIYAGVSSLYFPRANEFAAVDAIAGFLASAFPTHRLVYRPVELDAQRQSEIQKRYDPNPMVRVEWPSLSEIGLADYSSLDHDAALVRYVQGMAGCKVLVMSNTTTLCIDAAFLAGCGIISNRIDPSGVLAMRQTAKLDRAWYPGLRIATTGDELLNTLEFLLRNPGKAAAEASELVSLWDYPDADFESVLHEVVYGSVRSVAKVAAC